MILIVSTTMSRCSTEESGRPYLASPSPETCLQNTVRSFEAIAYAERLEHTAEDDWDFSDLSQRRSSVYSVHQEILESYCSEASEERESSPEDCLQPATYSTSRHLVTETKRDYSSRSIFSPTQNSRTTLRQFPEISVNTTSVKPQLPIRLKDIVAQEQALEDNARRMQGSSCTAAGSTSLNSSRSALLPLRESCLKGNEGYQRVRMNKNLPPSLRIGHDLQQERPMSSFSYSSDDSDSSSGTRISRRLSVLPRLGGHFSLASKKRKTGFSMPSTPQSETFQAFKKGRKRSTSSESHRRFPRHLLILSPRLSKGPEPVTAVHATVLPNSSRKPSGPHTPYPRNGRNISFTFKRPVASKVADSIHMGTNQIRSMLDKAKKSLAQTSQERRRVDLKRSIVRVDRVNQTPDGHACKWI
jgi:hypothetical protein